MSNINEGEFVVNDLDGQTYVVVKVAPRFDGKTCPVLLGNQVYLEDRNGNIACVYEWEVTKVDGIQR
jgi:hypothetical protein